ncbi:MAG: cation transporter [Deltaproteobacteria bacterium]|nr:cation transporter [Deltaproteobacteria bacterium]
MQRAAESRRLKVTLTLTALYFVAELVGGLMTNSLALLSDAGHMLSDIAALSLSLFAFQMTRRPATPKKTYGYHRMEILAALINGLILWLIVGVIFHAAYYRIFDPPEVQTAPMLAVASLGLLVNIVSGIILFGSYHHSLNIRGAFLHVLGDALGSIGAIVAGLVMFFSGWYLADPLISLFIGCLILYTSWSLVKESINILMQSVPSEINVADVHKAMEQVSGVRKIHDLHVWAVTSGVFTLSAHAVINPDGDPHLILDRIEEELKNQFSIEHTTIQLEIEDREEREFRGF